MKKLLSLLAFAGMLFVISCSDDEPVVSGPSLTAPAASQATAGASVDLTFSFTADGGFASSSAAATGGTATVSTDGTAGASSGDIVVSFAAGAAGAGSVTLTVTDANGNTDDATAVITVVEEITEITVSGNITGEVNWTSNITYTLDTRVTVESGATLNIEAGTVIKGAAGQGANSTALVVARGGTLNASGTAAAPIIFTSVADEITPEDVAAGNFASPNLSSTQTGLWGGIIILGNAPITAKVENADGTETENLSELQIEGIPSTDTNGLYGGDVPEDNSGTISYISIRHGGTNIGSGNEINGLTLGGVGSGTSISWVEVVGNADDGIEFFGGNVSVTGAMIWNSNDDSMDSDQDWVGTVENFIIVTPVTGSAFELDGPEGDRTRGVHHTFNNGIVYGGDEIDHVVDWDGSTNASLTNIYFFGIEAGNVESFGGDGAGASTGWETDLAAAGNFFDGVPDASISFGVAVGSRTVGPDVADYAWTWAGSTGVLSDLGL